VHYKSDYPILKAARAEYERERAQERGDVSHVEQPTMTEDDEAADQNPRTADDE
jgi:hypothetical protein